MKYIRTKDGIIDLSYCRYFEKEHTYWNGDKCYSFQENEIIKQADTIEELCDEFVRICEIFNIKEVLNKEEKRQLLNKKFKTNKITYFYGAIWTDKGLIYVAKMNDKGELELL